MDKRCLAVAFVAAMLATPVSACPPAQQRTVSTALDTRLDALLVRDRDADADASEKLWQALADDARRAPTPQPEVLARSLAWLAWNQGSTANAAQGPINALASKQAAIAAGAQDQPYYAEILAIASLNESGTGKLADAARDGEAALASATRHFGADSAEVGLALYALGFRASVTGDGFAAEDNYRRASELFERCLKRPDSIIVDARSSHAAMLDAIGRAEDALAENARAVDWAVLHLPDSSGATTLAMGNLAVSLRNLGRGPEAEAILREVLDRLARYQAGDWFVRATQLSNYATTIFQQGRYADAETLWLKARDWHAKVTTPNDPVQPSYPVRFAADAAEARGDLKLALGRRVEAVAMLERAVAADHPALALARIEYAATLSRTSASNDALTLVAAPVVIVRTKLVEDSVRRIGAEIAYAGIVGRAKGAAAGYAIAAPVAARLEAKLLDSATQRGDLVRYGPVLSAAFARVADLAFAAGNDEAGFRAIQLANLSDIVLVSTDLAARAAAANPAAATLARAVQDGVRERQVLERERSFAASNHATADLVRLDAELQAKDGDIARRTTELDRVYPAYRAAARPTPRTLAEVKSTLGVREVLVAPLPVDDGTLAVVITREGVIARKTPYARPMVESLTDRIRRSIDAARGEVGSHRQFDRAAAASLYRAIVPAEANSIMKTHPSLLYYASGALAAIPPSLLIEHPARAKGSLTPWLIRTHDVTVLSSLASRAVASAARGARFLGIGAPILASLAVRHPNSSFRGGGVDVATLRALPALPGAATELRKLKAAFGGTRDVLLTGAEATEARLKTMDLRPFGIIAIATHGLTGGNIAGLTEPALVLTPPAVTTPAEDGVLTASEIAALRLDADWVILSACNSASGGGANRPTYSGLAAAFVQAGSRSLLVSHWPVRDDAAERLTVATVRGARLGLPRSVALQRAMLALMADARVPGGAHPAIWAPFVLIGR